MTASTRWRSRPRPKMRKKKPVIKWIRCSECRNLYTIENPCQCKLDYQEEE